MAHLVINFNDGSFIRADHWDGKILSLPGELDEITSIEVVAEIDSRDELRLSFLPGNY